MSELARAAKTQRHISLLQKVKEKKVLSKSEIEELERLEGELKTTKGPGANDLVTPQEHIDRIKAHIAQAHQYHPNPKSDPRGHNHWASSLWRLYDLLGRLDPSFRPNQDPASGTEEPMDKETRLLLEKALKRHNRAKSGGDDD